MKKKAPTASRIWWKLGVMMHLSMAVQSLKRLWRAARNPMLLWCLLTLPAMAVVSHPQAEKTAAPAPAGPHAYQKQNPLAGPSLEQAQQANQETEAWILVLPIVTLTLMALVFLQMMVVMSAVGDTRRSTLEMEAKLTVLTAILAAKASTSPTEKGDTCQQ